MGVSVCAYFNEWVTVVGTPELRNMNDGCAFFMLYGANCKY